MSTDDLAAPDEGTKSRHESVTVVDERKLSQPEPGAAPEAAAGAPEAAAVGENGEPRLTSDSGTNKTGSKESKELASAESKIMEKQRKESQSKRRRVSMFDDKSAQGSKDQDGELKETLAQFFSSAPKEANDTGTALKPLRRPKLIYENTYRMESAYPFSSSRVQSMMQPILEEMLMDFKYASKTSAHKATEIAEKIRRNVLAFRFDRYKICVLVTISPLNRQGFFNGFRCLWDANRDSYAVATIRNTSIFAIAVVYGVYFE
ncbi:unnamed protein product [Allacma fusca]|uniref:Uncharacterized protein n=1 Tax=Allacma fusca TaxID=39272 RepID=A0A8J2PP12_9HEXA|nr:unnamed protein product [Allacma fusca]